MATNDNIFVGNDYSVTTPPTSDGVAGVRKCGYLYEANEERWGIAPVGFIYSVETTKELSTNGETEKMLLESVSAAIIDSIYNNDCSGTTPENGRRLFDRSSGERSLTSSQRRLGIQSIAPGNRNQWRGECEDVASNSGNTTADTVSIARNSNGEGGIFCNRFDGSLILGFDNVGDTGYDFESVGDTVISRIQNDMTNGMYIDRINQDLLQFDVVVTRMAYIESDYLDSTESDTSSTLNSLNDAPQRPEFTAFTKVTIPLLSIMAFLILVLCFFWSSGPVKFMFKNKDSTCKGTGAERKKRDKSRKVPVSLAGTEPHDLSRRTSNIDVPHCSRESCPVCQNQNRRSDSAMGCLSLPRGDDAEVAARRESPAMNKVSSARPRVSGNDDLVSEIFYSPRKSRSHVRFEGEEPQAMPGSVNFIKVSPLVPSSGLQSQCSMDDGLFSAAKSWSFLQSLFGKQDEEEEVIVAVGSPPRSTQSGLGQIRNFIQMDDDEVSHDKLDFSCIPLPPATPVYSFSAFSYSTNQEEPIPPVTHTQAMNARSNGNRSSTTHGSSRRDRSFEDPLHKSYSARRTMLVAGKSQNNGIAEVEAMDIPGIGRNRTRSLEGKMNFGATTRYITRQLSLENVHNLPIEIGTRIRTLTDENGMLRQELEL
jgi:hypothetical protein